jgi:hypothetical protein
LGTARTGSPVPDTIRWTTTPDDLVDSSRLMAGGLRRVVAAIGVAAGAWGLVTVASGDAAFGIFLVAYGLGDIALVTVRPVERALIVGRARHLVGRAWEVAPTADGLLLGQAGATGTLDWRAITSIREDARTIVVVADGSVRYAIPKRALGSPEAAAAFRDALTERITRG